MKPLVTVGLAGLAALALALPSAGVAARQASSTTDEPAVVKVTAKKYDFEPSTISVVRGKRVRLEVTAVDRDHGIEIAEFGVKRKLEKGKPTVVEFTPDRAGEFTFHCSVFCGLGHRGMKGRLIVAGPTP